MPIICFEKKIILIIQTRLKKLCLKNLTIPISLQFNCKIYMMLYENLVFGSSGVIGTEFINKLNIKNSLFTSRKKPITKKKIIWQKIDLDYNNLDKLPNKVKTIFFFASPYYTDKNLKMKDCFKKELLWLKKIIKNINCEKFVFTSSSSVYSNNHQIGIYKKKIEKELSLSKIKFIQIWRPFSLIGFNNRSLSDHFYNVLIKDVFKKKKETNYLSWKYE